MALPAERVCRLVPTIAILFCSFITSFALAVSVVPVVPGDVKQIEGGRVYQVRNDVSPDSELTIFCWKGRPKTPLSIWESAKVNLTVSGDDFTIYSGPNVSHVRHLHKILQESWFTVLPWKTKTISVAPFNGSCTGVFTAQDYTIQLDLRQLNLNRLLVFAAGLVLFFVAPALCRKVVFHYTTGTLVGVLGSVLIALYLLSRLVPKKGGALAVLAGGGSLVLFALRQLWDNCYSVLRRYHYYVAAYLAVSSAVSFAVCYRWGPLTDGRSLQLLQWTLQALGLALVFLSSDHQEAVSGVVVAVVCLHNFPTSWTYRLVTCWRQRFPPKVQLLTESEYLDQGRLETKKALDELRTFCRSPQCNAWRTVGRLQQPLRFAEFIEGQSHLSDREVLDYESEPLLPDDDGDDDAAATWTDDESDD